MFYVALKFEVWGKQSDTENQHTKYYQTPVQITQGKAKSGCHSVPYSWWSLQRPAHMVGLQHLE